MPRLFASTTGPHDWRSFLAKPEIHWKIGYSAHALAHCWEAAGEGFPPEIQHLLETSSDPYLHKVMPLLAIPEFKVELPGGDASSQNDIFVIAVSERGAVSIMVEGKVAERFGNESLGQWGVNASKGKIKRWDYLCKKLDIQQPLSGTLRYQLFHRMASSVIEAERLRAAYAIMIVHSFSSSHQWFEDYHAFVGLFGAEAKTGQLSFLKRCRGIDLYAGWATGTIS